MPVMFLMDQEEFSMEVLSLVAMVRRIQDGSFTTGCHGKKNSAWKFYHWLPWQEEFSMEVLPLVTMVRRIQHGS